MPTTACGPCLLNSDDHGVRGARSIDRRGVLAGRSRWSSADGRKWVAGWWKRVRNGLGARADFSYPECYQGGNGPIAQLDRVTDFYSVGCRFESCWDRHSQLWLSSSQSLTSLFGKLDFRFANSCS